MARPVTLGLVQLEGPPLSVDDARRRATGAAADALRGGADLVILPELAVPGYTIRPDLLATAGEPLDGPTVATWTALARKHGGLIAGGFCEVDGDDRFNTAVIVDADGPILHYRKLHLFDAEKDVFRPGDLGLPLIHHDLGVLAVCVCYDLRFVEVVRSFALRGAELIVVPTAWVRGFDAAPAAPESLIPQANGALVQANLSQVFIACASQSGISEEFRFLGSSLVADPYGAAALGPLVDGAATALVTVDLDDVGRARHRSERIRPLEDRRSDVYSLSVEGRPVG